MPVEFLGIAATNDGTEIHPRTSASAFDKEYTLKLARAHEDFGWDRILFAYGAGAPEPAAAASYIVSNLERIQILLAHRPNVSYPTFAAKTFATLDQISGGRVTVHVITGGNDTEQQREGDFLSKDERYDRTREYIQIVKKVWTSHEPFDHHGTHYQFNDFVSDIFPVLSPGPTSRSVVRRRRPMRSAAPKPTSMRCGVSRSRTPRSRSPRSPIRPLLQVERSDRACRSPSGRSLPPPTNWPGEKPNPLSSSCMPEPREEPPSPAGIP